MNEGGRPPGPAAVLGFLLFRTFAGGARRRLRRLKEPRYLLGTAFALLYFGMLFGRSGRRPRSAAMALASLPPAVLLGASAALTALALLAWLFKSARASLPLSETEVQFLFPAPLPRRTVLRFALLRTQIGLLLGSLILSFFNGGRFRTLLPTWLVLTVVNLHAQGIGFTKSRWSDLPARRRAAAFLVGLVLPLAGLALAGAAVFSAAGWALPPLVVRAGEALLFPARLLLLPAFRTGGDVPPALLGGAAIVVLHFLWVDRSAVRFEEATLALAARRAEMRRRRKGGAAPLLSVARRADVPFPLAPVGPPAVAIFWKNILAVRRTPIARQLAWIVLALFAAAAAGAAVAVFAPAKLLGAHVAVAVCVAGGLLVSLITPFTQREDFRTDLLSAELVRSWPLSPAWIAAGELSAPLFVGTVRLLFGLGAGFAIVAGSTLGLRLSSNLVTFPQDQELVLLAAPRVLFPWLLAALVLVPPLLALLLVVQNGVTLAFPAWFPPGPRQSAGPEVTGMRIVSFLGTVLVIGFALVPAALAAGIAAFLGRGLGAAWLPALAPVAAIPLALEVWAGLHVLGALLARFDPALDAGP